MNTYIDYLNCKDKHCSNENNKLMINKKLIQIQQKIIKAKTPQTQEKYIKKFNELKVEREFRTCMISKCKKELFNNEKDMFENSKLKLVKLKGIPKIILQSIETCEYLFNKKSVNSKELKILKNNIDNLTYYTNYLIK